MLENVIEAHKLQGRVVAIDPNSSRREKMEKIARVIGDGSSVSFHVADITEGKKLVNQWTGDVGCNAVLEVTTRKSVFVSPSSFRRADCR